MSRAVVVEADRHRNGVAGEPFYVGILDEGRDGRKLVVAFPDGGDEVTFRNCRIAVLDLDKASQGNIYMNAVGAHEGGNAWRGDHYESAARQIAEHVEKRLAALYERRD